MILDLCTGYGGLSLGLGHMPGAVAEVDPWANRLLAARFPEAVNVGDIGTACWSGFGAVDLLTAGYPCQPFSSAGQRRGTDDSRHLWPSVAHSIGELRPASVVLENVAGHLTLGFDVVLADLAALGYDAEWLILRASDVGACHRRARLWVLAWPARGDAVGGEPFAVVTGGRLAPVQLSWLDDPLTLPTAGSMREGVCAARPVAPSVGVEGLLPTPAGSNPNDGEDPALWEARRLALKERHNNGNGVGIPLAQAVALLPTPNVPSGGRTITDADQWSGKAAYTADGDKRQVDLANFVRLLLPTPTLGDAKAAADSTATRHVLPPTGVHIGDTLTDISREPARWGDYAPAIARHETVFGSSAPSPTDDKGRLSPAFVEWMMMLPAGWVTGIEGIGRTAALRLLGNGVVPACCAAAVATLTERALTGQSGEGGDVGRSVVL